MTEETTATFELTKGQREILLGLMADGNCRSKAHFQTTDKVLAACGRSRADLPPEGQVRHETTVRPV